MAYNLAAYQSLIANILKDSANAVWSTNELSDALRLALMEYSNSYPHRLRKSVPLTASSRFYDLTTAPFSITDILWIDHVLYPYDETLATGPLLPFELHDNTLVVLTTSLPLVGEVMHLAYALAHTITNLDSATETTVPNNHAFTLATGAAGHAAIAKSGQIAREFNWPPAASKDMLDWSSYLLDDFRRALDSIQPLSATSLWANLPLPPELDP